MIANWQARGLHLQLMPQRSTNNPYWPQHANKQPTAHIKTVAAPLSPDDQTAMLIRENKKLRALVATLQQRLAVQAGL